MTQVHDEPLVERARIALARHEWLPALDLLTEADASGALAADELELLAQATWWNGRLTNAIEVRERAYAAALKAGDVIRAATEAILLARDNAFRMDGRLSIAWANRADRLLADVPEGRAHGWLAAIRALQGTDLGRTDAALEQAGRALTIARDTGDRDLEAFALACRGFVLVYLGRVDEGLAALDEATVTAVAGELEPETTGGVCCTAISTVTFIGDWQRVAEWTEAQDRWCRREHINGYPGMCRLYRAEAKRLRGDWLDAEAEARRASDELAGFLPAAVGLAHYELGVLRLMRGDLPAAEESLVRAHAFNRDPEPALSLLRLAEGNAQLAMESIRRAVEEPPMTFSWAAQPGSDVNRLALLPAQVEIALAAGDVGVARRAADGLTALGDKYPTLAVRASVAAAQGRVLVAEGDRANGQASLRQSIDLWNQLGAPYEAARARLALGQSYAADASDDRAVLEIQAARATFERLGATLDRRAADTALGALPSEHGLPAVASTGRAQRTFVFTDIVDSTRFAELMGDAAWHDLLRWHDQLIRSTVAEYSGQEVKTVGDGFFLAFETTNQALDAAVAIQRRLAEQRRSHGFAPVVRIGLHRAEADRAGLDYVGTGVNTAARVSAQAGGGEILASSVTLEGAAITRPTGERRTVVLKGIAGPVEVVPIDWR